MAVPKQPLVLDQINWQDLSLGQFAILSGRTDDIMDFRDFLLTNSNWVRADINKIAMGDLTVIMAMITKEIEKQVAPNGNSPNSNAGQEENPT